MLPKPSNLFISVFLYLDLVTVAAVQARFSWSLSFQQDTSAPPEQSCGGFQGKGRYKIPLASSACILGSLTSCNIYETSWRHLGHLDGATTYSGFFQRPLFLANVQ